jgi:hypothetical protein
VLGAHTATRRRFTEYEVSFVAAVPQAGPPACTGIVGLVCETRFGTILTYAGKLGVAWGNMLL